MMRTNSSDECETNSQLDKVSLTQFVQVYFIEFKMEEGIGHDPMSRLFLNIMTIIYIIFFVFLFCFFFIWFLILGGWRWSGYKRECSSRVYTYLGSSHTSHIQEINLGVLSLKVLHQFSTNL